MIETTVDTKHVSGKKSRCRVWGRSLATLGLIVAVSSLPAAASGETDRKSVV